MNNLDFDLPSFASPPPPPAKNSRNWLFVFTCCGCVGLIILLCACCGGATFFALRNGIFLATLWGNSIKPGDYGNTDVIVCRNSPAMDYTRELENQGASMFAFSAVSGLGDEIIGTAQLKIDGKTTDWKATFHITKGGTLGRCIDRIDVTTIPQQQNSPIASQ